MTSKKTVLTEAQKRRAAIRDRIVAHAIAWHGADKAHDAIQAQAQLVLELDKLEQMNKEARVYETRGGGFVLLPGMEKYIKELNAICIRSIDEIRLLVYGDEHLRKLFDTRLKYSKTKSEKIFAELGLILKKWEADVWGLP